MCLYNPNCLEKSGSLTETVELGVFVPYPDEGREAKDQRRPSVLRKEAKEITVIDVLWSTLGGNKLLPPNLLTVRVF